MSELPQGWDATTLGDIVTLRAEKASPAAAPDALFLGLEDVEPHTSRVIKYGRAGELKSAAARFSPGEVLYSRLRPYLNKVVLAKAEGLASAEFLVLRPATGVVDADFIRRRIMTTEFLAFTASLDRGDRPRVDYQQIANFRVDLPPLAEQRRIVAKLDTLTGATARARAELDRIPALIARYKQAILSAAFTGELTREWRNRHQVSADDFLESLSIQSFEPGQDLPNLPPEWSWASAGDLCQIKSGLALGKKRAMGTALIERPYLRVANVQRGWLDLTEIKKISVTEKEADALYLRPGDILMNEGGDRDKLGRGWIWEGQIANCIHQNHVFRLRPKSPRIPSRYISYYSNEFGQAYFLRAGKQTTNLASISMSNLSALPVPVAPPDEMERIVQLVETAFAWLDRLAAEHGKATRLLPRLDQEILAKAFRGELVPQDPTDEPASALLERIRAERAETPKQKRQRKPRGEATIRAPREKSAMTKSRFDDDVKGKPYLAGLLRETDSPVSAEDLFKRSELPVADFYKQLAWEVDAGHIRDDEERLVAA